MSDVRRPALILLDVNETLSDLTPMAARFEDVGAPGHLAKTWFATVLRDGFSLAAAGSSAPFADIAADVLGPMVGTEHVEHVMEGFTSLDVHPDVSDGLALLAGAGIRLVTLSNGAASVAAGLLERSGLEEYVERCLSVEDAGAWKPAARAYSWALGECGVEAGDAMLVAVHPWDIDGAVRAGLAAGWVDRQGAPYPAYFSPPSLTVASFTDLAQQLGDRNPG